MMTIMIFYIHKDPVTLFNIQQCDQRIAKDIRAVMNVKVSKLKQNSLNVSFDSLGSFF
jgi:hypothetical protein